CVGGSGGHVRDVPLGEQAQAQQRGGVVAQGGSRGGRQQRPPRGIQVTRLQDSEQAELSERNRVAVSDAVVGRSSEAVLAKFGGQAGEVRERIGCDPFARPV